MYERELIEVKELCDQKEFKQAFSKVTCILDDDPEDARALFLLSVILISENEKGLAYNICSKVLSKVPERPEAWVNYGKCQTDDKEGWEISEQCFKKALELKKDYTLAFTNLSSLYLQQCKPKEAKVWAKKALEIEPENEQAFSCLGFANLMLGKWEKGFRYYDYTLGISSRPVIHYGNTPRYDGSKGQVIMVNGEQGIGDELIYSSFLRDIAKDNKVIYDCMPRLKSLMERSFADEPNIYISGDRWGQGELVLPDEFMPTCSASAASLGQYVRKTDSDFSGQSHLKADPEMRKAMRGLLGDKPKVGIAWTGGTKQSRQQFRQEPYEKFKEFFIDEVEFISLQYKDPGEIDIKHYPWITEIKDYDLTAALVSELDLVIGVPTSVIQLAGAVGTEAWCLVPEVTGWLFYRDEYVWADSVKLFHNWTTDQIRKELKGKYGNNIELLNAAN